MTDDRLAIFDIMACNVYWDFGTPRLPKEQHKFLVALYPTGGTPAPELIDSISVSGPGGYSAKITNQLFTAANTDGHIFDRTTNAHWYMLNVFDGFMDPGEYVVEVHGKDGSVARAARVQDEAPSKDLVSAYTANSDQAYASFSPGQGDRLSDDVSRDKVDVTWSSLKTIAGQDAYYIFRLSEGSNAREFDTQNLHWWDNVFLQRLSDPTAGLNRDRVTIDNALEPGKDYVYFTEITDSNAMGETNICIFQPHQSFRA